MDAGLGSAAESGGGERERYRSVRFCARAARKAAFTTRRGDSVRADLVRLVLRARSKTRRGAKEKLVASYRIRSLTRESNGLAEEG